MTIEPFSTTTIRIIIDYLFEPTYSGCTIYDLDLLQRMVSIGSGAVSLDQGMRNYLAAQKLDLGAMQHRLSSLRRLRIDTGVFESALHVANIVLRAYPPAQYVYVPIGASPLPVSVAMSCVNPQASICHVVMSGRREDPDVGLHVEEHTRRTPSPELLRFMFDRFFPQPLRQRIQASQTGSHPLRVLVLDWSRSHRHSTIGLACNYLARYLQIDHAQVPALTLDDRVEASFKSYDRTVCGISQLPEAKEKTGAIKEIGALLHKEVFKHAKLRGMQKITPWDYIRAMQKGAMTPSERSHYTKGETRLPNLEPVDASLDADVLMFMIWSFQQILRRQQPSQPQ